MRDYISDMLVRIKNGQKVGLASTELHVTTPKSCVKILDILTKEGFIYGYEEVFGQTAKSKVIRVILKYNAVGVPAISNIFRISTPGRRIYVSTKALWKPKTTTGIFILSTPKGFHTDRDARFLNLGGELICGVY